MSEQGKLNVLYFEDDLANAQLVCDYLQQHHHQVWHYPEYPKGGIAAIRDSMRGVADIVIMDVNMPTMDGYQLCQLLRQELLTDQCGVIFTSGLMLDEDIMRAYAAGADDYLIKPLRLQELEVKLHQVVKSRERHADVQMQASTAMKLAFDAMRNSSELGQILRFQDSIHQATDFKELATLCFGALQYFELSASIIFLHEDQPIYYRDDGLEPALELDSMLASRGKGRLFCWKQYAFLNYDLFSMLIRNMPINDEDRYGVIKDQICLLFNSLDIRITTLLLEKSEQEKQKRIKTISQVLANIVLEMEQSNIAFSQQFEKIIQDMETNLLAEMSQFNLLEAEEVILMRRVEEAMMAATQLFDSSLEREVQHRSVMNKLLDKLAST
jgi:DNA-binding response OmpR family regulator